MGNRSIASRRSIRSSKNVVAGFAGNVQVGFSMLAALQQVVREVSAEQGKPANIGAVLERFSPFAAKAWGDLDGSLQKGGCAILLAGASPIPDRIYSGDPVVARLGAPVFDVELVPRGTWASIGSGLKLPATEPNSNG